MGGARLRPAHRLRTRPDFDRVFASPSRLGNRAVTLLTRANDLEHARLGLVVSKRVDKRAVVRNRIKRQIREGFRHHLGRLGNVDVVVIPRAPAAQLNPDEWRACLEGLWQKLVSASE